MSDTIGDPGNKPATTSVPSAGEKPAHAVLSRLPIIRMMSRATTPKLAAVGMTPNQATALGMVSGLVAAACFAFGSPAVQILGGLLFALATLLDYCDGELARLRGMGSKFGAYFDDFVDWIVHAALFLGIGYHAMNDGGNVVWMWLGAAAALGGTISAILPLFLGGVPEGESKVSQLDDLDPDAGWLDVLAFAFRGLARADFWLIVVGLALGGWLWVLLPAAAIGAQVFWLLYLRKSVRRIIT